MPKQLINTVGIVIVIAIVAVGLAFVAVPLGLQALSTLGEVARVQQVNTAQEAQVDRLEEQSAQSAQLDAELTDLQAQIPTTPRIDTVSALISEAAESAGVTVTGITPNAPMAFTGGDAGEAAASIGDRAVDGAVVGHAQIPVQISVIAGDDKAILAFIDELRGGPRLLGDIDATISSRGGADATISALAFADIAASGEGE